MRTSGMLVRTTRTGLLVFAAVMLVLYGLSHWGLAWTTRAGSGVRLSQAELTLSRSVSPAAAGSGWSPIGASWVQIQERTIWVAGMRWIRSGPPTPGSSVDQLRLYPGRVALVTAMLGLLLFTLPTRRPPQGCCEACGYERTGLAVGAICPECGAHQCASRDVCLTATGLFNRPLCAV